MSQTQALNGNRYFLSIRNKTRYQLLIIALAFAPFLAAQAQNSDTQELPLFDDDLLLTEINPLHPLGMFNFSTPFYIGSFNSKGKKLSIAHTPGNIWHPEATIYCPQNMTAKQQKTTNTIRVADRPVYFKAQNIESLKRTFSSDGVLQDNSIVFLWQLGAKGSFVFKLNTYVLSGGDFLPHFFASDKVIEKFHTVIGIDDNFGRKQFPFDQAHIHYIDENGQELYIPQGKFFFGSLDTHYYHPIKRLAKRTWHFSSQIGTHLSLPLNNYYPKVAGGISGTLFLRKKLTGRASIDLAADYAVSHYALAEFGNSVRISDHNISQSGKTYLALNFISKRNPDRVFAFGLANIYKDALLKGYDPSNTRGGYKDLGAKLLQPGDTWMNSKLKVPLKQAGVTIAALFSHTANSYVFWHFKTKKASFTFSIGEDYFRLNNAPDIQYGLQYTRSISF